MTTELKLNLGCGSQVAAGWLNVDYAIGARLAKKPILGSLIKKLRLFNFEWFEWKDQILIHDLTKTFPWQNETVSFIYSSHTLEHLDRESGLFFLKECHRVLREDGVLRIVVPDLEAIVKKYISGALKSEFFLDQLYVLRGKPPNSTIKKIFWPYVGFPHQCMYDHESILRIMGNIGFISERKKFADSAIPNIETIEIRDRTVDAVVVEGRKSLFDH